MKLVESINFVPFYEKIKDQVMPVPTAYKLSKIYKATKEDSAFYQEKLRAILTEYAEIDEDGNFISTDGGKGIKLKPDTQEACAAAINELQEIESDIKFDPISIDSLSTLSVSPSDIESIMGFIAQ